MSHRWDRHEGARAGDHLGLRRPPHHARRAGAFRRRDHHFPDGPHSAVRSGCGVRGLQRPPGADRPGAPGPRPRQAALRPVRHLHEERGQGRLGRLVAHQAARAAGHHSLPAAVARADHRGAGGGDHHRRRPRGHHGAPKRQADRPHHARLLDRGCLDPSVLAGSHAADRLLQGPAPATGRRPERHLRGPGPPDQHHHRHARGRRSVHRQLARLHRLGAAPGAADALLWPPTPWVSSCA